MVRIEKLEKNYGKRKVLRGLDVAIRRGTITGIAGPNACGKTTLIKCLLGIVVPDGGSVVVEGRPVTSEWEYRRRIGYMPQYPDFPANLKVGELLAMLEDLRGNPAPRRRELMEYFELGSIADQGFGQLSGGTKQKVAAVAAFMFDAPLIVLDEPTAGLDPLSTLRFKDLLRREALSGKTILLVSHIMTEVDQLVEDMLFVIEGRAVYSGSLSELKSATGQDDLERAITELAKRSGGRR